LLIYVASKQATANTEVNPIADRPTKLDWQGWGLYNAFLWNETLPSLYLSRGNSELIPLTDTDRIKRYSIIEIVAYLSRCFDNTKFKFDHQG